jgi:uncharacterized lipoprotein YbaY
VRVVRGRIQVPVEPDASRPGTLHLTVEDVGLADAASRTLGRHRVEGVLAIGGEVPFELRYEAPTPPARVVVRAFLDLDGDGRLGVGDWTSTRSYAVPPDGDLPQPIALRKVEG